MKLKSKTTSLSLRLVSLVAALLLGQQALAEGTAAGTTVDNTASVDYFVGGIDQADIPSNTVTFVVDRRVNFTLTPASTPDLLPVSPGGVDYFVDFYLTNLSNSDLDFDLGLLEAVLGVDVDGSGADTVDMGTLEYAISGDTVANGDPLPVRTVNTGIIDELGSDESIRIRVFGDAALTLADGQIAGAELTATAFEAGGAGVLGAPLIWGAGNDDTVVDNVDVNGNDGVVVSVDGFIVEAADLNVAKSYTIIDGDLGSGSPIPGARLQYEILISNAAGASDATNIVVSDLIDSDLDFLTGVTGSDFTDIEYFDGTTATECTADDGDTNGDGCSLDVAGNLVVGDPVNLPITITAGSTFRVRFQALIPVAIPTP